MFVWPCVFSQRGWRVHEWHNDLREEQLSNSVAIETEIMQKLVFLFYFLSVVFLLNSPATCKGGKYSGPCTCSFLLIAYFHCTVFVMVHSVCKHVHWNSHAGQYFIQKVVPQASGESSKVKVKVRVNIHGIFSVSSASLVELQKSEEEEESMDTEQSTEKENEVLLQDTTVHMASLPTKLCFVNVYSVPWKKNIHITPLFIIDWCSGEVTTMCFQSFTEQNAGWSRWTKDARHRRTRKWGEKSWNGGNGGKWDLQIAPMKWPIDFGLFDSLADYHSY